MTNTLKVVKPFLGFEVGDILAYNADTNMYESEYNSEYHENDEDDSASVIYNSTCKISSDYVQSLVEEGYLVDNSVDTKTQNTKFVNVFDEIDNMLASYHADLANIDADEKDTPECLKVEKRTVLSNLIKALNHLKELKK